MIRYEMYCCTIHYTSHDPDPVSYAYGRLAYRMDRQAFSFCQPPRAGVTLGELSKSFGFRLPPPLN